MYKGTSRANLLWRQCVAVCQVIVEDLLWVMDDIITRKRLIKNKNLQKLVCSSFFCWLVPSCLPHRVHFFKVLQNVVAEDSKHLQSIFLPFLDRLSYALLPFRVLCTCNTWVKGKNQDKLWKIASSNWTHWTVLWGCLYLERMVNQNDCCPSAGWNSVSTGMLRKGGHTIIFLSFAWNVEARCPSTVNTITRRYGTMDVFTTPFE